MWSAVYHWLDNSNFGGALIGVALPGGLIFAWTHWLHRQHKAEMHARHDRMEERLDALANHLRGSTSEESDEPAR